MQTKMDIPQEKISDFCQRWQVVELALFGSILRDNFRPDSNVDMLVQFAPDAQRSLFDLAQMQDELQSILGRETDLVSRDGVEKSRNYIRRKAILESAQVIYGA